METIEHLKKRLWWLLTATTGGATREKILVSLAQHPMNTNELAHQLGVHYTTVRYHLDILKKNNLVWTVDHAYAKQYYLTEVMTNNIELLPDVGEQCENGKSHGASDSS